VEEETNNTSKTRWRGYRGGSRKPFVYEKRRYREEAEKVETFEYRRERNQRRRWPSMEANWLWYEEKVERYYNTVDERKGMLMQKVASASQGKEKMRTLEINSLR
jgi:hypothetical protein